MSSSKRKDIFFSYLIIGFLTGLFLSFLIIYTVLYDRDLRFSFTTLSYLHSQLPLLYFTDLFSLFGLAGSYFFVNLRAKTLKKIEDRSKRDSRKNEIIKSAIHEMTIGNFHAKILTEEIDDDMASSLRSLQERLQGNKRADIETRREEKKRNWTSTGLAEFGDILRSHSSSIPDLSYAVISNLVRYLDINQGGFFIIENGEDRKTLKMIACHAYDRNKFPDKIIEWGEGLIGAVAIEKKTYYTDKIPDGYLTITSGLGKSNPRHLLLVPMVLNNEVFGVFELASFSAIEPYQIQFVERVAENSATTLNIMASNMRTEHLLRETQEQAAKLADQEEEVRRHVEELKQIQIEAAKQSEEFISFSTTVNHTLIRAEYNVDGKLEYANTKFLRKLGYSGNREVEGQHISMFIDDKDLEWFDGIWENLAHGGAHFEGYMKHVTKLGQDLWTMATYTCIRKEDGEVDKVLFLAIDSTEQKEASLNFEGQIAAINRLSPKAEFSPDGKIIFYNELFKRTYNYSKRELANLNIFDFAAKHDQERLNEIWEQVVSGTAFQGQLMMLGKFEEEVWLKASFTAVYDMYGEVEKIVFLAFDISKERELELSMRDQNAKLKEKEEEMRIQSIDLKKQMNDIKTKLFAEMDVLKEEGKLYLNIVDQLPEPVIVINNQNFIRIINGATEKKWKFRKNELIDQKITAIFSSEQDNDIMQSFVKEGVQTLEARKEQVAIRFSNGHITRETISILKTDSGSEVIYTLVVHCKE